MRKVVVRVIKVPKVLMIPVSGPLRASSTVLPDPCDALKASQDYQKFLTKFAKTYAGTRKQVYSREKLFVRGTGEMWADLTMNRAGKVISKKRSRSSWNLALQASRAMLRIPASFGAVSRTSPEYIMAKQLQPFI
jgi:hypothetical protein